MTEYRSLWIEATPETKERQKVLGGGTVSTADRQQVDGAALAKAIASACNAADSEGYDVLSILGVDRARITAGGYGAHSITDGVILTARRKKTEG
jgi:hypothetical protein